MTFSNLSQVLLRNKDLLSAEKPLLINMPNDTLGQEVLKLSPQAQLSYFDNNYAQHLYHKNQNKGLCHFAAYYQSKEVHDLIIISFPKSKNELNFTLAMLTQCSHSNTRILIVGENKSGIKSLEKLTKNSLQHCDKIDSARHCVLFQAQLINNLAKFELDIWYHYYQVSIGNKQFNVAALPGVFSQAKLDKGTAILLEQLNEPLIGDILDFGCGAGVIACFIGLKNPQAELVLADVSALALTSAQKTLEINDLSGQYIATDSLSNISGKFSHVISNPPFHQGVKTHYAATEQFLANIAQFLLPRGKLTIVANSFLRYQEIMNKSLNKVAVKLSKQGFTIYQGEK